MPTKQDSEGARDLNIRRRFRHFLRYRQITRVFLKHGLGYLIQRVGMEKYVPFPSRYKVQKCERESDYCMADKLTHALMELGPTFVKFGQVLSTRADILSPSFIAELERLQDKVSPVSIDEIKEQIAREIGPVEEVFAYFDPQPLAAASIGQVHRATLKTGEQVIIKVQRPNIEAQVKNDLEIFNSLAHIIEKRFPEAARIGLVNIIEDYSKMMRLELDYDREAKNTDRMRHSFAKDGSVVIPAVYWDYTTPRVLTEEFIEGIKLSDLDTIEARGWSRNKISQIGTQAFLSQVLMHGFFQADPHPGNILVLAEDKIAFIDFGQTGSLTERRLIILGQFLHGIGSKNVDKAMSALFDLGIIKDGINLDDFEGELTDMVERIYSSNMGGIDINVLRQEILSLTYRYQLNLPSYLTSLMKALITLDGVGKKLDPNFNLSAAMEPIIKKSFAQSLHSDELYKKMQRGYYRDIKPLLGLPNNFNNLVKVASRGDLEISHNIVLKKHLEDKFTQLANRISASLIIAGGLISTSLLLQGSEHPSAYLNDVLIGTTILISLLGVYAFLISGRRS
jgi:ubiquinone biosynthesis protein